MKYAGIKPITGMLPQTNTTAHCKECSAPLPSHKPEFCSNKCMTTYTMERIVRH